MALTGCACVLLFTLIILVVRFKINLVGNESFQGADVDRLIDQAPIAGCFAAVVTDPSTDAGEGIIHFDNPQCIFPTSFSDKSDITLNTLTRWAGIPARCDALASRWQRRWVQPADTTYR